MAPYKEKSVLGQIRERNIPFFFAFIFVFISTLVVLSALGVVPVPKTTPVEKIENSVSEAITGANAATTKDVTAVNNGQEVLGEAPVRITAAAIAMDQRVVNPLKSDPATLDKALMSGVVRYPGSAYLGQTGNVLLFGHSSYLKIVRNQAYKEFNGIQNFKTGDIVTVYSNGQAYDYSVSSVKLAKADDFVIDLGGDTRRLTLVTCNTFASKQDRFVVEADFVSQRAI